MAIIDTITGYYGFTLDGTVGGTPIDENGQVNRCIIAIVYPVQSNDVDVEISNGKNDWAVQMGDGEIIPCSNPEILYINRDNTIVQFDMDKLYPSNSPCTLVYHSDTASFKIVERSSSRPFEVNAVSGHFAFTVNGYEGPEGENGNVKRILATIPFPYQISAVKVTISDNPSHWGARMGNGEIIPLRNPEVVATNSENVIVKFEMDEWYPSNSPCILVYRSKDASINIKEIDDDHEFYPVNTIIDVPNKMISGQTLDLNIAKVTPWNATNKNIDWAVVEGPGRIEERHYLYATGSGKIVLRATIENSLEGNDDVNDFVQSFDINVEQNIISKLSDPISEIKAYVGEINHTIAVVAKCTTDKIKYQWFKSKNNTYDDAVAIIENGNKAEYCIPNDLEKGDSYFFCVISSDGAASIKSKICHIYASIRCTAITIYPLEHTMDWESSRQMYVKQYPSDADLPHVNWFSSNDNIASFDDEINPETGLLKNEGLLRSKLSEVTSDLSTNDTVTITAITTDMLGDQLSASIDIKIKTFVPVQDIVGLTLDVNPNQSYTLSATVLPNNATNKNITWSVSDSNNTDISIIGNKLTIPNTVIPEDHQIGCVIMASIDNGSSTHNKYQKEFSVFVTHGFIAVNDIVLKTDNSIAYDANTNIEIEASVLPIGSSMNEIIWSLVSGPGELHGNTLILNEAGDVTVRATVKKGAGSVINQIDFSKDFKFTCNGLKNIKIDNVIIEFTRQKKVVTTDDDGNKIEKEIETKDNIFDPFQKKFGDIETVNFVTEEINVIQLPETGKKTTVSLINAKFKKEPEGYGDPDWETPADFWTTDMETINDDSIIKISDNKITVDRSKIITGNLYICNIQVTIEKGKSSTEDLIFEKEIFIQPNIIEPFVPLENISFVIRPSVLRALSPIIVSIYDDATPKNASVYNTENNHIRCGELVCGDLVEMNYSIEMLPDIEKGECGVQPVLFYGSNTEMGFTVKPLSIFKFDKPEFYLYPWNPGRVKIRIGFNNATVDDINNFNKYYPDKIEWYKEFDFTFLPPFIPVGGITGMPDLIYANQYCILPGEAYSITGTYNYNPAWDDEDITNKDIKYSIISNNCGATLTGKMLKTTSTGSVKIRATIKDGLKERIEWYADSGVADEIKVQESQDFIADFVINVADEELEFSRDIVTLTLEDNSTISIKTFGELLLLSTPEPSDSSITIKGTTFRKDQVKYAKFYENVHNDIELLFNENTSSILEIDESDSNIKLTNGFANDLNDDSYKVSWEVISGIGGNLSSGDNKDTSILTFDHNKFNVGEIIIIKCTFIIENSDTEEPTKIEREVEIKKVLSRDNAWQPNPNLTSLENFGRNFINLIAINRIPDEVSGAVSLRNFLRGCTSLNCEINIPSKVTGDACLENFLRDCTSFNSIINIPNEVSGAAAMHGFMMNCTSFNKPITIPTNITGDFCLKKFMYGCSSFNQPIIIPRGISGFQCMFEFMAFCSVFNQPLTLPDDVGNITSHNDFDNKDYVDGYQLDLMLYNCNNYHSTITVPPLTGLHAMVSERTFASAKFDSPIIVDGITLDGDGANTLCTRDDTNKLSNNYKLDSDGEIPWAPYRHITNLD